MTTHTASPVQLIKRHAGWALALGILVAVMGIVAMTRPFMAGIAATVFFGVLLLIVGVSEVAYAVHTRHEANFGWRLIVGAVRVLAGGLLLFYPLGGLLTLTLVLGAAFLAEGGIQALTALAAPALPSRGWILATGVLNVIVGLLILTRWPSDALWAIGLFVGISLVVNGVTLAVLSGYVRSLLSSGGPTGEEAAQISQRPA
jgi:uncharacterized membrane protein HdeD (DUF308 family)